MADEYSTPLDMLMPPSEPDKCQPYPSMTPQQTNGACRGQEVMDRTYEVPQPSMYNFATDARPQVPNPSAEMTTPPSQTGGGVESFNLPGVLMNLQNISIKEYILMIAVVYIAMNQEAVSMVMNNAPSSLTSDKSKLSLLMSVLATLLFYVAREYLVYM